MSALKGISGIRNLLICAETCSDPATAARAASNVLSSLLPGLAAIGHLMFVAGQAEEMWPASNTTIANLGCLIKDIADLADELQDIESEADYQAKKATPSLVGAV